MLPVYNVGFIAFIAQKAANFYNTETYYQLS